MLFKMEFPSVSKELHYLESVLWFVVDPFPKDIALKMMQSALMKQK
jgi:hypothetical protein